jgi:NAD(P)H-hydrate epimerase
MDVSLCLAAPEKLGEVPAWQHHVFKRTPGKEITAEDLPTLQVDLILDALIGYSLKGAPSGLFAELIEWANSTGAPILSLDVPSGMDSTTGEISGDFVQATTTMTLALPKTGLEPESTGQLVLADIGIPRETFRRLGLAYTPPFDDRYLVPLKVYA